MKGTAVKKEGQGSQRAGSNSRPQEESWRADTSAPQSNLGAQDVMFKACLATNERRATKLYKWTTSPGSAEPPTHKNFPRISINFPKCINVSNVFACVNLLGCKHINSYNSIIKLPKNAPLVCLFSPGVTVSSNAAQASHCQVKKWNWLSPRMYFTSQHERKWKNLDVL